MSLHEELKRRLNYDGEPIKKRLKLAENVLQYPLFPLTNRGDVVLEWFYEHMDVNNVYDNELAVIKSLKQCVNSLDFKTCSCNTVSILFEKLLSYLDAEPIGESSAVLNHNVVETCLLSIENTTITSYFQQSVNSYFSILNRIIENASGDVSPNNSKNINKRLISNLQNFIKLFNKKALMMPSFLETGLLWKVLDFIHIDELTLKAFVICQTMLFPKIYSSFYKKYMAALIRSDAVDSDELPHAVKAVMNIILKRTMRNHRDFVNLLELFVYSYKFDQELIYLFNIILCKYLGVRQAIFPVGDSIPVAYDDRDAAKMIYLKYVTFLSKYNVKLDANYKDADVSEDNVYDYTYFLQATALDLLSDDTDVQSLAIIKQLFTLEPDILEPALESLLPHIMIRSKSNELLDEYNDVMLIILEYFYKMSRGPDYLNRMLKSLKDALDQSNLDDLKSSDVFPEKFCNGFGRLNSDLVPWQHINLYKLLADYLNDYCLSKSVEDLSTLLFLECLCSLMSTFHYFSKMGDQNIPESLQSKFCNTFESFGTESLSKFSKLCFEHPHAKRILKSFLKLCQNYGHLKLILWQYQPYYNLHNSPQDIEKIKSAPFHISNVTLLHSYINHKKWKKIFDSISKFNDADLSNLKVSLILQNDIAIKVYKVEKGNDAELSIMEENIKEYLIQNFQEIWSYILQMDIYLDIVLSDLSSSDIKHISRILVDQLLNEAQPAMIHKMKYPKISKDILSEVIMEMIRRMWAYLDTKSSSKYPSIYNSSHDVDFNVKSFLDNLSDSDKYINKLTKLDKLRDEQALNEVNKIVFALNNLPVEYMNENVQNCVIFSDVIFYLMAKNSLKFSIDTSIIEFNCNNSLMKIFELSYRLPNILSIFSAGFICRLVECDFFQFTSQNTDECVNLCELFKRFYFGGITKDTVHKIKDITDNVVANCNNGARDERSTEVFSDVSFQALSQALIAISGFKKSSASSEMKTIVNKLREILFDNFLMHVNKIEWKNVSEDKILIETNIALRNMTETIAIVVEHDFRTPQSTILENNFQLVKFFMNFSISSLSDPGIVYSHARGAILLINVVLKNFMKYRQPLGSDNEESLFRAIWVKTQNFLRTPGNKVGHGWKETIDTALENVTLICELCDVKFCSSYLTEELIHFNKEIPIDASDMKIMQKLWYCFLNADMPVVEKNEARSKIIKQMTKCFFFWLRNIMNQTSWNANVDIAYDDFFDGEFENISIEVEHSKLTDSLVFKNIETLKTSFEIITAFVNTKKMIFSHTLIDTIIQMPGIVNFNITVNPTYTKTQSFEVFYILFDKCITLINALLTNRSELLQDRWPSFLQVYRKLIYTLCSKSNSDQKYDEEIISRLVKLAIAVERLTQIMVNNVKQDISRIASYIIADIINSFQKVSIYPSIKFHLQNNINCLMQLLDNHSVGFLMRNLTDASRIMFQQFYDNYKKYYKYTGMS